MKYVCTAFAEKSTNAIIYSCRSVEIQAQFICLLMMHQFSLAVMVIGIFGVIVAGYKRLVNTVMKFV